MGDHSAHNESGGPRPLVKTRLRRPRRWRKGMEVKDGPAPREEEAGWAKQNVCFLCRVGSFFFFCLAGWRSGSPSVTALPVGDGIWINLARKAHRCCLGSGGAVAIGPSGRYAVG